MISQVFISLSELFLQVGVTRKHAHGKCVFVHNLTFESAATPCSLCSHLSTQRQLFSTLSTQTMLYDYSHIHILLSYDDDTHLLFSSPFIETQTSV